jgi:hypothetical protein
MIIGVCSFRSNVSIFNWDLYLARVCVYNIIYVYIKLYWMGLLYRVVPPRLRLLACEPM